MDQSPVNDPANPAYSNITWVPDLLYVNGHFRRNMALACSFTGRIIAACPFSGDEVRDNEVVNLALPDEGLVFSTRLIRLRGRALVPGMVNAHSHAFQRVIRGRTECRSHVDGDSFWTWREMMYHAAARLSPDDIYDASRMAFLEMAATGITSVGEFHYLQRTPEGTPYTDPNLLAKQVVAAARDVGLRIALLRVAYARSGFGVPPNAQQRRFIEPDVDAYLRHVADLDDALATGDQAHALPEPDGARPSRSAWVGIAPHSVRAVPLEYLRAASAFAAARGLPVHMHIAEQPAEVSACRAEHGRTPVALLADEGLLSSRFTGIHAIHITPAEIDALARAGARVCACPTTERNLGDGIIPADALFAARVPIALGTDSHTQIDLLEDARELEYHLRLLKLQRAVLAPDAGNVAADNDAPRTPLTTEGAAARLSSSIIKRRCRTRPLCARRETFRVRDGDGRREHRRGFGRARTGASRRLLHRRCQRPLHRRRERR